MGTNNNFNLTLPKGSILEIEDGGVWKKVTEHNRRELSIGNTRIEETKRMANGTLRKHYVADKLTFSLSWDMVPGNSINAVEGRSSGVWAVDNLKTFYSSAAGRSSFRIQIKKADLSYEGPYTVIFKEFSPTIVKRGIDTYYNLSIEFEEV
jgi:hypothetical protein